MQNATASIETKQQTENLQVNPQIDATEAPETKAPKTRKPKQEKSESPKTETAKTNKPIKIADLGEPKQTIVKIIKKDFQNANAPTAIRTTKRYVNEVSKARGFFTQLNKITKDSGATHSVKIIEKLANGEFVFDAKNETSFRRTLADLYGDKTLNNLSAIETRAIVTDKAKAILADWKKSGLDLSKF